MSPSNRSRLPRLNLSLRLQPSSAAPTTSTSPPEFRIPLAENTKIPLPHQTRPPTCMDADRTSLVFANPAIPPDSFHPCKIIPPLHPMPRPLRRYQTRTLREIRSPTNRGQVRTNGERMQLIMVSRSFAFLYTYSTNFSVQYYLQHIGRWGIQRVSICRIECMRVGAQRDCAGTP